MTDKTIAVVFGGNSPEHDISILTGLQCERVLQRAGADAVAVYWDRGGEWHLVPPGSEARHFLDGAPAGSSRLELRLGAQSGWFRRKGVRTAALEVDVVLNCFHGGFGESGGAQSLFEAMGVPATGGTPAAAALGMDKLAFKTVVAAAGVPSLPRVLLRRSAPPPFPGPYLVKPRFGGSSIGIERAADYETALALLDSSRHLRPGAVVEPYRDDVIDLNIAYRTAPRFETSMLEKPLRPEDESAIYSYEQKYLQGEGLSSAPRELPAQVPAEVTKTAEDLAGQVAELTGLTGIVRVDFLYDGTDLFVNEVNSIPGAMALYLWPAEVSASALLLDAVEEARRAPRLVGSAEADGAALRSAGGIAGKLVGLDGIRSRS
ncbi:MAG TPA: hypothetical protein VEL73_10535 [Mycobacteriales bacterium]|nr:hypothetical protein [Mycobacteriales bacterium]